MKTIYNKLLLIILLLPMGVLAQSTLRGRVVETSSGLPLPGVNVVVQGTTNGTSTDFDGNFVLSNVNNGDQIVFSYVGFAEQVVAYTGQQSVSINLDEDTNLLNEVIVQVGYGTVRKKDATGAITTVTEEQFNKGPLTAVDHLIQGKVAGLQISNGGGAAGEGSLIRIRGGSSLSANNDPLYVIDGIPVDTGGGGVAGGRNPLAAIHPNDLASVTVLKDASATAIYGSRASNGVVIITTKKGRSGDIQVDYNANFSIGTINKTVDNLSADEFRQFIAANGTIDEGVNVTELYLGTANTDWQDEIYRVAYGTDHNVSISGGSENITYRTSVGFTDLNGILLKDNFKRTTISANLIGDFFDKHLKIEFNNRSYSNLNNYSNRDAIGAAVSFDPTQNIYDSTYGYDYFQWLDINGTPAGQIPTQEVNAGRNPLSLINQKTNKGSQTRSIGNIQFDYKLHFLPELKAVANFGYDYANGISYGGTDLNYVVSGEQGSTYENTEEKKNRVMDLYLNYNRLVEGINTRFDVTAGYNYQNFNYIYDSYSYNAQNDITTRNRNYDETVNLQSYFARANITISDRYLLTASIRRDGTSRFTEENRWGNFPSAAAAWRISEEAFLKDSKVISDLKFRASWGMTGQQEVGDRYPTTPLYANSTETGAYQIGYDENGNPIYIQPYRPQPYNLSLKWEETEQINFGVDYGLFNNRIVGSAEVYRKYSSDLIVFTANPQGVGFSNQDFYNIGDMEFKGVELSMDVYPIKTDKVQWRVGGNITFQDAEVTKLNLVTSDASPGIIDVGGISGGTGNFVQNHQVGYSPNSFYVFEQAYDTNGMPVEGVYIDRNEDGIINADDLYRYKKPTADVYYGFNTDVSYHNWNFSMSWRGSYGNYVYNNVASNLGNVFTANPGNGDFVNNASASVLDTNFQGPQYQSDYYVQDASFVRLDNITLGYTFVDALGKGSALTLSGNVQNVLVITDYDGLDPEVNGGIDNNLYPRPTTYTLGLNVNF